MSARPRDSLVTRDAVLAALARHIGRERGIKGADLVAEICGLFADGGDERRLRHVIQALREDGEHICGKPITGYFMAASAEELEETRRWLYSRSMTTLKQWAAMGRISLVDLLGQLRLPT